MKVEFFAAACSLTIACAVFAAGGPKTDLNVIGRLDNIIQARFADPQLASFGMNRVAIDNSLGAHFMPLPSRPTDFAPNNVAERETVDALESHELQTGFYVFGAAVSAPPTELKYRALKGPAVVTAGTPRPNWYPGLAKPAVTNPGALPDWDAIYPLAQRAMRSFHDGGKGFEATLDGWNLAARPVVASQDRCVACHNQMRAGAGDIKLNQAIGGVLYAYRRTQP
jgi:hypothetical protein